MRLAPILFRIKCAWRVIKAKKFMVYVDEGIGMHGISIHDAVVLNNKLVMMITNAAETCDNTKRQESALQEVDKIINSK